MLFKNALFMITVIKTLDLMKGAVHKRCLHKIAKNWPPLSLSTKCPHWLNSSLSERTHHKFQKIRSFLLQKVRTSASEELPLLPCPKSALDELPLPLWLRTSFMDGPKYFFSVNYYVIFRIQAKRRDSQKTISLVLLPFFNSSPYLYASTRRSRYFFRIQKKLKTYIVPYSKKILGSSPPPEYATSSVKL